MARRREADMTAKLAVFSIAFGCCLACGGVEAHDVWADNSPVPSWVKASCCGPDDAHHLRPDQVHRVSDDYYMVDGYRYRIPAKDALPSQDGDYWIFYRDGQGGNQSIVYCFFVPMYF
jgi:hypothetical protein